MTFKVCNICNGECKILKANNEDNIFTRCIWINKIENENIKIPHFCNIKTNIIKSYLITTNHIDDFYTKEEQKRL